LARAEHLIEKEKIEVLLVTPHPEDEIRKHLGNVPQELPVEYHVYHENIKSGMRNYGISKAAGEIIYFVDDDIVVKEDFLEKIIKKFRQYPEIDIIGGPNLTPPSSSILEKAQGYILSSFWGSLNMSRRYKLSDNDYLTDQTSLILCNMGFRKKIFDNEKLLFDVRLDYNEENDLLKKMEDKGYKMLFSPEIITYHFRRPDIPSYCKQVLSSGIGRGRSIRIDSINFSFVYILPLLLVIYIVFLPFFINQRLFIAVPLIVYLIINFITAVFFFVRERKFIILPLCFLLFFMGHFCYGAGLIKGLIIPGRQI
jgi:GT2 family glycosyltransferase